MDEKNKEQFYYQSINALHTMMSLPFLQRVGLRLWKELFNEQSRRRKMNK